MCSNGAFVIRDFYQSRKFEFSVGTMLSFYFKFLTYFLFRTSLRLLSITDGFLKKFAHVHKIPLAGVDLPFSSGTGILSHFDMLCELRGR